MATRADVRQSDRWTRLAAGLSLLIAALGLAALARYAMTGVASDRLTPSIWVHLSTVLTTSMLGAWLLLNRKGDRLHRLLGRIWMVLMLATATAALFIHALNPPNGFSPIHLFVLLTYFGVARAYLAIRKGEVAAHRAALLGVVFGGIVIAGGFVFIPGRLLATWLFG